ncbi:hypothetical protein K470DRAFT_269941 [Piedraia hortae CBS 480.64]|uniref:Uncharacterized protein n=1 Tax=Piedraia hortae CBS 480.64 TaxID=1314780 RepID=A0A6A7C253_9PEZI|nr:hypothetical protein K470DRAFT_269941 [Piedraia hortae CBS 480.64]
MSRATSWVTKDSLRSFSQVCRDCCGPEPEILWQEIDSKCLEAVPAEHRQDFVQTLHFTRRRSWVRSMRTRELPRLKSLYVYGIGQDPDGIIDRAQRLPAAAFASTPSGLSEIHLVERPGDLAAMRLLVQLTALKFLEVRF